MKVPVYNLQGEKKGDISLGRAFSAPVRVDVIRRAFLAEASMKRQPYAVDTLAGKRTSAHYHGLRHYRYTMMNREMARMKRIHNQGYMNYTARFVPQATKGRKTHPPKLEKIWKLKINKKERRFALLSALAASAQKNYLLSRGHVAQGPFVFENSFQTLKKTKDILMLMEKVGILDEFIPVKRIRAGKGKMRGRKYRRKKGPLIILSEGSQLPSLSGAEVKHVKELTVSDLAPGGDAGRLCIWTEASLEEAGKL